MRRFILRVLFFLRELIFADRGQSAKSAKIRTRIFIFYFPGLGAFQQLFWLREGGNLNTNFPKIQKPGGLLGGGGGNVEASI